MRWDEIEKELRDRVLDLLIKRMSFVEPYQSPEAIRGMVSALVEAKNFPTEEGWLKWAGGCALLGEDYLRSLEKRE
jgi:hypothetical protein